MNLNKMKPNETKRNVTKQCFWYNQYEK